MNGYLQPTVGLEPFETLTFFLGVSFVPIAKISIIDWPLATF